MNKLITILLLLLLIFVRIQVRSINSFWTDELAQINSLKSIDFLIKTYLPSIPGGSVGHYLLIYPLQQIFPYDKYILGMPGLISHVIVFLLIPNIISMLQIVNKDSLFISSFVARLLFILDPMLTFQAMEVRPYSLLPLLWAISFFLIMKLVGLDKLRFNVKIFLKKLFIWLPLLFLILNWHFYGVIMVLSIYIFIIARKGIKLAYFRKLRYSFLILLAGIISSLPFWRYFSRGSFSFNIDTISTIPATIMQIYSIDKGFPKGMIWQNWIYFILLIMMIIVFIIQLRKLLTVSLTTYRDKICWEINIFLVIIPVFIIFILDYLNHYGFWYRQFLWVLLPFYIANAVAISGIFKLGRNYV